MKRFPLIACCAAAARPTSRRRRRPSSKTLFARSRRQEPGQDRQPLLEFGTGACCVCDLEPGLEISQPTVSYHLKRLTDVGLLEREKRGTFAYYRLAPRRSTACARCSPDL